MRIEMLPGLTNVIRFPVERRARPTLELLREIAPDPREVGNVAEAFGLDYPVSGLRDAADASTAGHCHVVWGPSKFDREAEFA